MLKLYNILLLLVIVSCNSDVEKVNYLDRFSTFIEEIETLKNSEKEINWNAKADSLKMFEERKSSYILTQDENNEIDRFIKRYADLQESNRDSEMKVNFYFENSASMNGYLGGKNFKQVIHRIYGNLYSYSVKPYFVNTKEYPQTDILDKIDKKSIKVGDVGDSDHQFIFSNAIENSTQNNLSIVITDGIYSVKDGDIDVVSIALENAFKAALAKNEIETVVLKLSSNFDGIYYSETCRPGKKAIKVNQDRPYYVLLFGSSESINNALSQIAVIDELPGFEQQARFFLTKNLKTEYTILMQGEEKHGQLKATKRGADIIHEVEGVKKFERPGFGATPRSENYVQFGVAIDFSNIALPNTYIEDVNNYWIDDVLGYNVTAISNVQELEKTSKTFKEIERINRMNKTNFTHVITVRSEKNLYGNLDIQLLNNLPAWIEKTGTENDCETVDEKSTFAFDELMIGISKAYQKINDNNHYIYINLKTKV